MNDKICPIMSRPQVTDSGVHIGLARILCLQELCMAWIPECELVDPKSKFAPDDCMDQPPGKPCKRLYRVDCQGYCKLIERGS